MHRASEPGNHGAVELRNQAASQPKPRSSQHRLGSPTTTTSVSNPGSLNEVHNAVKVPGEGSPQLGSPLVLK